MLFSVGSASYTRRERLGFGVRDSAFGVRRFSRTRPRRRSRSRFWGCVGRCSDVLAAQTPERGTNGTYRTNGTYMFRPTNLPGGA